MTVVLIAGAGLVGRRCAARTAELGIDVVLAGIGREPPPLEGVRTTVGVSDSELQQASVLVIATSSDRQLQLARRGLAAGCDVIATSGRPDTVQRMLDLHTGAHRAGRRLVVGASYAPGLSTVLAAWLAQSFDEVRAITTARFGTGGPACARDHHRSMSSGAREVHSGALVPQRAGTGRMLIWFPDPVGAADCYRAGLVDPVLLHRLFPRVPRIEARQAATRRDRLTARLPMLRPPHAEGLLGAVWAEVRGRIGPTVEHRVVAATAPQATGAAMLAAAAAQLLLSEDATSRATGACTVVDLAPAGTLLSDLGPELHIWSYDGLLEHTSMSMNAVQAARKPRLVRNDP